MNRRCLKILKFMRMLDIVRANIGALFLRPLYNILIMFSNWDSRSTEVHWVLRVTSHLDLTRSGVSILSDWQSQINDI